MAMVTRRTSARHSRAPHYGCYSADHDSCRCLNVWIVVEEESDLDGQRFDQFTRLFSINAPRRQVLRALVGGVAAGLVGRRTPAHAGETCNSQGELCGGLDGECCEGLFCDIEGSEQCELEACTEQGDTCVTDADCCEGLFCPPDQLDCEPIPAGCTAEGEECAVDADCCDDFICPADRLVCEAPAPVCAAEGEACTGDDACCDGICCAGACRAIECCIDEADPNARCPEGTSCFEGICEEVSTTCADDGDCPAGACCCPDGSCRGDCCAPVIDDEDTGGPVLLPNTGVGRVGQSNVPWLSGAAAAAAAAAAVASRRIRRIAESVIPDV